MADFQLGYSVRDPQDVEADLLSQIATETDGEWTDVSNNDIGYAVVQAQIELADLDSHYLDFQVKENFLSLCQLPESAWRAAKMLDYVPYGAQPATTQARLTFPAFNSVTVIPANSVWRINGISFTCTSPISIPPNQTSLTISLVQGTPYTPATIPGTGASFYKIAVPSNICGMVVKVNGTTWASTDSFIGITDPRTYKVYQDTSNRVICFGDGDISYKPNNGDVITVTGILTGGASGNIVGYPYSVSPISVLRDGNGNEITNSITAQTTASALGGTDIEDIDSIRVNAPAIYSTQGRCVTASDYAAVIRAIPGVKDVIVIGGQDVGQYGNVIITVYADSPYLVSDDFLTLVKNTVLAQRMLVMTPIVKGPDVVEVTMTVQAGVYKTTYLDLSSADNAILNAISGLFDSYKLGSCLYESDVLTTVKNLGGVQFVNKQTTVATFANSQAGKISIPLIVNYDLSNCTLKDNSGNVLFSGDGTSLVTKGRFVTANTGMSDQKCTLSYSATGDDVLIAYNQVVVLTSLPSLTTVLI